MAATTFHIVDVFAEQKYAGNQLAVFRNAGGLSSDEMQKIAKEMNFSETTFILSDAERDGGYDVRIFTPATGSANSCFAAYMVKHRCFGADQIDVRVEQGHEIGRPSLIYLRAKRSGESIEVNVGGKVIPIARAELV